MDCYKSRYLVEVSGRAGIQQKKLVFFALVLPLRFTRTILFMSDSAQPRVSTMLPPCICRSVRSQATTIPSAAARITSVETGVPAFLKAVNVNSTDKLTQCQRVSMLL